MGLDIPAATLLDANWLAGFSSDCFYVRLLAVYNVDLDDAN